MKKKDALYKVKKIAKILGVDNTEDFKKALEELRKDFNETCSIPNKGIGFFINKLNDEYGDGNWI